MEGGEIKDPVQKGTPSYQDKIKKWTGGKYIPSHKSRRIMNILIVYHICIEFFTQVSFYVPDKRVCRQIRKSRKGAMPMFGIFHSGEEIVFSLDTIGNVAERRIHLLEEMPVMVYRLYEYIIKAKLTHWYEKKASMYLFYGAGELAGMAYTFGRFAANRQNSLRIHKIDVFNIGKEPMVTEINSWASISCRCGFQVKVKL
jgi:hypothetical protein